MSFQKQWSWDPSITPLVYREWEKKAKILYKDIIFTHRKTYEKINNYKPSWVAKEIWERWVSFWRSEDFQSPWSRGRRNRRRGKKRVRLKSLIPVVRCLHAGRCTFWYKILYIESITIHEFNFRSKSNKGRLLLMSCFFIVIKCEPEMVCSRSTRSPRP